MNPVNICHLVFAIDPPHVAGPGGSKSKAANRQQHKSHHFSRSPETLRFNQY